MDIKKTVNGLASSFRMAFKGFTPEDMAEAEKLVAMIDSQLEREMVVQEHQQRKEMIELYAAARAQARRSGEVTEDCTRVTYIMPLTKAKGGWFKGMNWLREESKAYGKTATFARCYPALPEAMTADGVRLPNEDEGGLAAHPHIDQSAFVGGQPLRQNAMMKWDVAPLMLEFLEQSLEKTKGYAYLVLDCEAEAVERVASHETTTTPTFFGRSVEIGQGEFLAYPVTQEEVAAGGEIPGLYLNVEIRKIHNLRLVVTPSEKRSAMKLTDAIGSVAHLQGIRASRVARTHIGVEAAPAPKQEAAAPTTDRVAEAKARAQQLLGRNKQ